MAKKRFNFKIFTSFMLFGAFLVLAVSGLVLFIAPPGRIANWTDWNVLGFSKAEWINFHLTFMFIFLITGILHLFYFNWKQFWAYIKTRTGLGPRFKKELGLALALLIIFLVGTQAKIPPVISISDLGYQISRSWDDYRGKAPAGNMNSLSRSRGEYRSGGKSAGGAGYGRMDFAQLTRELGMTEDEAREKLKAAGITKVKSSHTLREIGLANNVSPREVKDMLSAHGGRMNELRWK